MNHVTQQTWWVSDAPRRPSAHFEYTSRRPSALLGCTSDLSDSIKSAKDLPLLAFALSASGGGDVVNRFNKDVPASASQSRMLRYEQYRLYVHISTKPSRVDDIGGLELLYIMTNYQTRMTLPRSAYSIEEDTGSWNIGCGLYVGSIERRYSSSRGDLWRHQLDEAWPVMFKNLLLFLSDTLTLETQACRSSLLSLCLSINAFVLDAQPSIILGLRGTAFERCGTTVMGYSVADLADGIAEIHKLRDYVGRFASWYSTDLVSQLPDPGRCARIPEDGTCLFKQRSGRWIMPVTVDRGVSLYPDIFTLVFNSYTSENPGYALPSSLENLIAGLKADSAMCRPEGCTTDVRAGYMDSIRTDHFLTEKMADFPTTVLCGVDNAVLINSRGALCIRSPARRVSVALGLAAVVACGAALLGSNDVSTVGAAAIFLAGGLWASIMALVSNSPIALFIRDGLWEVGSGLNVYGSTPEEVVTACYASRVCPYSRDNCWSGQGAVKKSDFLGSGLMCLRGIPPELRFKNVMVRADGTLARITGGAVGHAEDPPAILIVEDCVAQWVGRWDSPGLAYRRRGPMSPNACLVQEHDMGRDYNARSVRAYRLS